MCTLVKGAPSEYTRTGVMTSVTHLLCVVGCNMKIHVELTGLCLKRTDETNRVPIDVSIDMAHALFFLGILGYQVDDIDRDAMACIQIANIQQQHTAGIESRVTHPESQAPSQNDIKSKLDYCAESIIDSLTLTQPNDIEMQSQEMEISSESDVPEVDFAQSAAHVTDSHTYDHMNITLPAVQGVDHNAEDARKSDAHGPHHKNIPRPAVQHVDYADVQDVTVKLECESVSGASNDLPLSSQNTDLEYESVSDAGDAMLWYNQNVDLEYKTEGTDAYDVGDYPTDGDTNKGHDYSLESNNVLKECSVHLVDVLTTLRQTDGFLRRTKHDAKTSTCDNYTDILADALERSNTNNIEPPNDESEYDTIDLTIDDEDDIQMNHSIQNHEDQEERGNTSMQDASNMYPITFKLLTSPKSSINNEAVPIFAPEKTDYSAPNVHKTPASNLHHTPTSNLHHAPASNVHHRPSSVIATSNQVECYCSDYPAPHKRCISVRREKICRLVRVLHYRGCVPVKETEDLAECPTVHVRGRNNRVQVYLWEFLLQLLQNHDTCPRYIRWVNRSLGIFKLEDSKVISTLWGRHKHKPDMDYDRMSRGLRYYYKSGILKKVPGDMYGLYTYQFTTVPEDIVEIDCS